MNKMRKTYCDVHMEFVDVTSLADSTPTTTDNQSIANINLLKQSYKPLNYATTELNMFMLDGSKTIMNNPSDIAFLSKEKSNNDCTFTNNPKITVNFTKNHTSSGITLYFGLDYPSEIKIYWYALDNTLIDSKVVNPDSKICTCKAQITNYGKVVIEFVKTRFPMQYASLQHVKYGILLEWSGNKLINANVLEEVDVTSNTLSINTANISILDSDNDFDIANENGAWKSVQKSQEVTITEHIDDDEISIGTFYVDDSSFKDNIASFKLIDSIGLMSQYTYYNGTIYNNETVGTILEDIFASANITDYSIDSEIYNTTISGWLGIQTCREALQMVCFSIGAVADDSRGNTIKIYFPDKYVKHYIEKNRKFSGSSSVALDEYVSGVSVGYSTYALSNKTSEVFNGVLPVGTTKITFDSPYDADSFISDVGTITETSTNYLVIQNNTEQDCTITGEQYEEIKSSYVLNGQLDASETDNIIELSGCTLVNTKLLPSVANKLLNYYQLRKKVSVEFIAEDEIVGQWVSIMTRDDYYATSLIESQNINLTGGFIAKSTCRGYTKKDTYDIFMGTEMFSYDNWEGVII